MVADAPPGRMCFGCNRRIPGRDFQAIRGVRMKQSSAERETLSLGRGQGEGSWVLSMSSKVRRSKSKRSKRFEIPGIVISIKIMSAHATRGLSQSDALVFCRRNVACVLLCPFRLQLLASLGRGKGI
jgi:hypothetical protein